MLNCSDFSNLKNQLTKNIEKTINSFGEICLPFSPDVLRFPSILTNLLFLNPSLECILWIIELLFLSKLLEFTTTGSFSLVFNLTNSHNKTSIRVISLSDQLPLRIEHHLSPDIVFHNVTRYSLRSFLFPEIHFF